MGISVFKMSVCGIIVSALSGAANASVVLMHAGGGETDFGANYIDPGYGNLQNSSLHLAIASAQPGDIVEIRDNLAWQHGRNNGYHINTPNITVRAGAGFTPSIRSTSAGTNSLFYVNAPGFTLKGLTLEQTAQSTFGTYAVQLSNGVYVPSQWVLPGTNTYLAQGLTIDGVTMNNLRGALDAGSGLLDGFTFTNNNVLNARYGLGKNGLNFGAGLSTISGNTFTNTASGLPGAPDGGASSSLNDFSIWIESLAGDLSITNNVFNIPDNDYAIYSSVVAPWDLTLSGNAFVGANGGNGAELNLSPLGGGYSIGLIPAPGAGALAAIGLVIASRRRR